MQPSSSESARLLKRSNRWPQARAVAKKPEPVWLVGNWDDLVALVSLTFIVVVVAVLALAG